VATVKTRPRQVPKSKESLQFDREKAFAVRCRYKFATGSAPDSAKFYGRSRDAMIRVSDDAGNVIETHEHAGDFKDC